MRRPWPTGRCQTIKEKYWEKTAEFMLEFITCKRFFKEVLFKE
jgi:hypothetical protein